MAKQGPKLSENGDKNCQRGTKKRQKWGQKGEEKHHKKKKRKKVVKH